MKKVFMICTLHQILLRHIKGNKMGGPYSWLGSSAKWTQDFSGKTCKGRNRLLYLGIDGRNITVYVKEIW